MKNGFAILRFSKIRNCGVDPLVQMGCPKKLPSRVIFFVKSVPSLAVRILAVVLDAYFVLIISFDYCC